ncbi:MAG: calcium/sodium antiporter [Clostridiales bacterium]|jgi:cation:H+ antiporter|nr:calcium/sodium antiporter [Clostridiales bacterium]
MEIALDLLLLVVGFVLLIQAAKVFVDASVNIAKRLKIPTVVIGLTVVAFGTSAPEVVISVSAAIGGSSDLAIANAVGSNLFNLLFIVGFCAMIYPFSVRMKTISRDYWFSILGTVGLLVLVIIFSGGNIPRLASLGLFVAFSVYMFFVVRSALRNKVDEEEEEDAKPKPLWKSIILAIIGIGVIVGAGQLTVLSAVDIATALGVSERIIGLTIISMGTSLPELVTTLIACRKKEGEFALGFIIGSSIFNIFVVLGIAGVIIPLSVDPGVIFDIAVLTIGTLFFYRLATTGKRLVRVEGLLMLLIYVGYMTWVLIHG